MAPNFSAFGWKTLEVEEGNDVEAVDDALEQARECHGAPTCIISHTVKGKGASSAEPTGASFLRAYAGGMEGSAYRSGGQIRKNPGAGQKGGGES